MQARIVRNSRLRSCSVAKTASSRPLSFRQPNVPAQDPVTLALSLQSNRKALESE
jgi:hypothetical protein